MNEKEKKGHQKSVEPVKVACLSSSTNSDSDLPKYSEIPYSHVDNMEKGSLRLQSDPDPDPDPVPVPPYSRRRHQEASIGMAQGNGSLNSLGDFLKPILWLIFWPAKIARIPEAQRRQENEALRLGWCLNGSIILNFIFSYKYLVPFIKESMKESVWLWFQITVAVVLVIATYSSSCSLLVDFIVTLIPLVLSGTTMLVSGISSFLSSLFLEYLYFFPRFFLEYLHFFFRFILGLIVLLRTENQFNDCNDNSLEQPSTEHSEQSPGLRREPGQSRDVENSGS
ncbi:uncharacterized protein SOCG_01919 [Schizosaccharomyces octosporus yFS286]|uniref:Uncharacterized protein n=1 Tax=Schizosaccharomyces octosporus (strain yFS286) TaxID=483514 RepID=S9QZM8_SCHOY|nr:uncharacterized protein SOCG_01919 [Schizosaccharomyces octosporus yFS286]EPX71705.1 hypothetical protein SOCG_01919 [Schizosaccharomyces octosporus yFS286]